MRYAQRFSQLHAEPLLITEAGWTAHEHVFGKLFRNDIQPQKVALSPAAVCDCETPPAPARHERILEIRTPGEMGAYSTAIIYVDGFMDKHVDPFDVMFLGICDLDDVDAAIAQVRNDESIRDVLIVFNSPGGTVIGIPETAERVYELARVKNVKAFSDSRCCSGGIYIASQASEFFVTASTFSGSIGVKRPPIIDISKQLAANGVKATQIKSGKFKDTGSMLRPITQEEIDMLQAQSDYIMSMFTAAVRRGRPRIQTDAMEGQIFFGDEAVRVGLADAVLTDMNEALAQF